MVPSPPQINIHQCFPTSTRNFDSKYIIKFFCACLYMKHQVQCSMFGTGTFHLTLLKPEGSLQINDSILPKDFLILWLGNCRMWRSDWWELFWSCSNELSAQINITNCFTKGKILGANHSWKQMKINYIMSSLFLNLSVTQNQ